MKRSILRAFALCLTTAFVADTAYAKDDSEKSSGIKSRTDSSSPTSTPAYSSETSARSHSTHAGQPIRVSKLINNSLRGQSGDSLGQVQDIVVDPASGQIQFVVLSLGGAAIGAAGSTSAPSTENSVSGARSAPSKVGSYGTVTDGRLVAVPWRLISSSGSDQYTATVDSAKLQSAPTFSSSSWPTMDSAWSQRVYSHFGVNAPASGSPHSNTGAPGSDSGTGTGIGTGTGLGNPATPGAPTTPGTPDITPPAGGASPSATPGTVPNASAGSGTSGK